MRPLVSLAFASLLFAAPAAAQEIDPETGEVYIPPDDEQTTEEVEAPPPVDTSRGSSQPAWYNGGPTEQRPQPPPAASDGGAREQGGDDDDGPSDHARVVGRLAVGFLGATTVPVGSPGGGAVTEDTVTAPALGVRYWISELVGLDVGVGLGYLGGTASAGDTSIPLDNAFAMNFHAGLPLAIFHEGHYKFLIIPEVNFGFATGTAFGATPAQDRSRGGLLFQIGGRLGSEIHFGFMDVPQLSLQASVGLYFEYTSASYGSLASAIPADGASVSRYGFGTSVQGEPWDILLGALNALYYF